LSLQIKTITLQPYTEFRS